MAGANAKNLKLARGSNGRREYSGDYGILSSEGMMRI
jgi:hypothetical protein